MNEQELKDLLARELRPVRAPEDLWVRIEAPRARPTVPARPKLWLWAVPAIAVAAGVCFAVLHVSGPRTQAPAVESVPVYEISQARTTVIGGTPVHHLVFTPEDRSEDISLFISASKVKLPTGFQTHTVEFPCSKQMCTIVCRKCSARAVEMLSAQLAVETPNYQ